MTPVNKTTQGIVDPDRMKGRGSPYSETVTQRLEVGAGRRENDTEHTKIAPETAPYSARDD